MDSTCDESLIDIVRNSNSGKKEKSSPECWVIGDLEFQRNVLLKDKSNRLSIAEFKRQGLGLEDVLENVSRKMKVPGKLILLQSKRTRQTDARKVFCYTARLLGFPTKEIGTFLGIQQAAVSNAGRKGEKIVRTERIEIM